MLNKYTLLYTHLTIKFFSFGNLPSNFSTEGVIFFNFRN